MPIIVTNVGLAAIRDADAGGFLVNLAKFSVSAASSVVLSISDTALVGPAEYTGNIKSIEPVSDSTVKLTLEIPVGKPVVGQWTIAELAILLQSGELFAHGVFTVPYTKSAEYSLKMIVYATASRIGEVINVNIVEGTALASTKYVRQLMKPVEAPGNVIAVMDQQVGDDGLYGASLAVKYGINWSYLGYRRSYAGAVTVPTVNGFSLDIEHDGGFWLNSGEEVIVQIVTGPGAGESRKVTYSKTGDRFVVREKPFSAISIESRLAIWRNAANALPARTPVVSEDFVLGHGVDTWQKSVQSTNEGTLEIGRKSFVANSSNVYSFDPDVVTATLVHPEQFLVFVNGLAQDQSKYQITTGAPGRLTFIQQPVVGSKISVVYFFLSEGMGSESLFLETTVVTAAATTSFGLPTIPDTPETVLILKDGRLAETYEYVFVPATNSLDFFVPVPTGTAVSILSFSSYAYSGNRTLFYRKDFTASGTEAAFDSGHLISEIKKVIVLVDGEYLDRSRYQVSGTDGVVALLYVPDTGARVSLIVYTEVMGSDVYTQTGQNTGPMWVDPAGTDGKPSYLVPKTKSYLADGATQIFEIFPVRDRSRILMFIGGTFQDPDQYSVIGTSVKHTATIPMGLRVDIISFVDVLSVGGAPNCSIANFLTTDQQEYELFIPIKSKDHVIVTVGGVYQHKAVYALTASSKGIAFDVPPIIGEKVRVWIFDQVDTAGWRTELFVDKNITSTGRRSYKLSETPTTEKNVLVFLNGIYQDTSTYSTDAADLNLEYDPGSMYSGRKLITVTFAGALPRTRLITRSEYNELLTRVRYLEACCAEARTGVAISTQSTSAATSSSTTPPLLTTSVPPIVSGDTCGQWAVTSHDWGIISTGYIYDTATAASGAAQLAYENVWSEGHPGDSRGVYLLVNPVFSTLGSVVGYEMTAQKNGAHVGAVARICSSVSSSSSSSSTTISTSGAPTTTTTLGPTTTSIAPGSEVITASGSNVVGANWTAQVSGATPYSTFYFTSGSGYTSPNISVSANGTATSGPFTYSSTGAFTITGYFSGTGHTRTTTASVTVQSTTTTTAAPTTTVAPTTTTTRAPTTTTAAPTTTTAAPTTTTVAPTTTTSSDPVGTVVKITSSTYWSVPPGWTRVRAIIVAGGGGGGTLGTTGFFDGGGGGGAGGIVDITLNVSAGAQLPVVIGAGGQAGDMNDVTGRGRNGGDSSFALNTATGGGGGGGALQLTAAYFDYSNKQTLYVQATYDFHGLPGGSGGGSTAPYAAQSGYNAAGISGQGFSGGEAFDNGFSGAGGGAGSRGMGNGGLSWGPNKDASGVSAANVSGGSGLGYTFSGTSFVVGGGGGLGGCTWGSNPSITRIMGGWGGGGNGDGANPGSVNTGGGGGGGSSWWGGSNPAGAGGSGVVYLVKV